MKNKVRLKYDKNYANSIKINNTKGEEMKEYSVWVKGLNHGLIYEADYCETGTVAGVKGVVFNRNTENGIESAGFVSGSELISIQVNAKD